MKGKSFLSMLSVLVLLALLGCSQAANGEDRPALRPDGRAEGPARLAGLVGAVEIQSAKGARFPARAGMWLGPDDEIQVPGGGLAVVWLKRNNYVVRIDEEVQMRIDDIFLLNAPPTEKGIAEQVDALLSPAERANAERIVGWRAGLRAAETVGHKREARPSLEEERAAPAEQVARPVPSKAEALGRAPAADETRAPATRPMAQPAPPPPPAPEPSPAPGGGVAGNESLRHGTARTASGGKGLFKAKARRRELAEKISRRRSKAKKKTSVVAKKMDTVRGAELDSGLDGEEQKLSLRKKKASRPRILWMRVVGGELLPQEATAPGLLQRLGDSRALKDELLKLLGQMGQKHVRKINIRIRIRAGRVDRLWVQGGLLIPPTLKSLALGKPVPGEKDGWLAAELVLR